MDLLLGNVEQAIINTASGATTKPINITGAIFVLRAYDRQTYIPENNDFNELPQAKISFDLPKLIEKGSTKKARKIQNEIIK